jgi:hypothetical protein
LIGIGKKRGNMEEEICDVTPDSAVVFWLFQVIGG